MIVSNFLAAKVICFARKTFDFCLIGFAFCYKSQKSIRKDAYKTKVRALRTQSPHPTDKESVRHGLKTNNIFSYSRSAQNTPTAIYRNAFGRWLRSEPN